MQKQRVNPSLTRAFRLLRAASKLGVAGAAPGPHQLLPLGARVLAQGYLNRFSMPLLRGWLLPVWMDRQSDPASPLFTPRSVTNLMVNQTARNWTALGVPGAAHPVESTVDTFGLLTPVPGGPSLDYWVNVESGDEGRMAPSRQKTMRQRMQGGLPVVLSAYEADGLRVSSEVWLLALPDADWAAMQVVLFNIADMPLRGRFYFALRPYNPEGISPVYNIAYSNSTLVLDGRPGPVTWPAPEDWALSDLQSGDLFNSPIIGAEGNVRSLADPHGLAHGVLGYSFQIEPWEEAEFLAFMPVHKHLPAEHAREHTRTLFPTIEMPLKEPDPTYYSRAKAANTIAWSELLDSGMRISLPHRDLLASWEANRAHLLALHDGSIITPGPDLYHSFWFRDAAYMVYALSACGYREAAAQLLRGFSKWQRRDGALVSHNGEWDGTGQALWAIGRHLSLHPDAVLMTELLPLVSRGRRWITRTLRASVDGLMPPGISSEHLGPPDRYYWDDLWTLAGLLEADSLLGKEPSGPARKLRRSILRSWHQDAGTLGGKIAPAAPGRKIDVGMIGSLPAWFPLNLLPGHEDYLRGTLAALESALSYEGALFVNTGHSGWGTYLNMRIAGCRLLRGLDGGWELMRWLLDHASPTYNWPEAIHPHSLGGSAGDGHHGWASAEWLLLIRALLFDDSGDTLRITPGLPAQWLNEAGSISVEDAPTAFGPLSYTLAWPDVGERAQLRLDTCWRKAPRRIVWELAGRKIVLPPDAKEAEL